MGKEPGQEEAGDNRGRDEKLDHHQLSRHESESNSGIVKGQKAGVLQSMGHRGGQRLSQLNRKTCLSEHTTSWVWGEAGGVQGNSGLVQQEHSEAGSVLSRVIHSFLSQDGRRLSQRFATCGEQQEQRKSS